jgi:hypothetical protein
MTHGRVGPPTRATRCRSDAASKRIVRRPPGHRTCGEQLLYEVDDPTTYLTPDVEADFSGVTFRQLGADRVLAEGATGRPRPQQLKVRRDDIADARVGDKGSTLILAVLPRDAGYWPMLQEHLTADLVSQVIPQ